ncbi:MAG: metalloregulator ArsR/SmtB family transcription factor [Rectinemataceae bacterium]|nr:metalloregulator ArsR/SmtB family transcription factor [Rectinemataceae bacterium]
MALITVKGKKTGRKDCRGYGATAAKGLINANEAVMLENIFKLFANTTRLRLLHSLVLNTEMAVLELSKNIKMKPQTVSNQLRMMAHMGIIGVRRDGNRRFYKILDPCVKVLLERGICLNRDSEKRKAGLQ